MIKVTKLKITLNPDMDEYRLFTFTFKFFNGTKIAMTETLSIDADGRNLPRDIDLDEYLDLKLHCCLEFDKGTLVIEGRELLTN